MNIPSKFYASMMTRTIHRVDCCLRRLAMQEDFRQDPDNAVKVGNFAVAALDRISSINMAKISGHMIQNCFRLDSEVIIRSNPLKALNELGYFIMTNNPGSDFLNQRASGHDNGRRENSKRANPPCSPYNSMPRYLLCEFSSCKRRNRVLKYRKFRY